MKVYKNTKEISTPHEKFIAKELQGKTVIASGAITGMKGDVITPAFLVECKATLKKYYILKEQVVEKIRQEALKINRIPLLAIRIMDKDFILFRQYDFVLKENTEGIVIMNKTLKLYLDNLEEGLSISINGFAYSLVPLENFKEELL